MYLKIYNNSVIEQEAFTLIGASTKRGDNTKIGFFGSGLKYGIAVLMRNGVQFKCYSNKDEIVFHTEKTYLRGVEFDNILVNGQRTSLTTAMGVDWELWQAIREIFCNALDEDGGMAIVEEIIPYENETAFYIEINKDVKSILDHWGDYFCTERKDSIVKCGGVQVFSQSCKFNLYRKGIKCLYTFQTSLYDYNMDDLCINESRVVGGEWEYKKSLAKWWGRYASVDMIRKLFDNVNSEVIENEFTWDYVDFFNNAWLDVIDNKILVHDNTAGYFVDLIESRGGLVLKADLVNALKNYFKDNVKLAGQTTKYDNFCTVDKTPKQEYLIKEVLSFFKECGFSIGYDIKVAIFNDKKTLGRAKEGNILLSVDVFNMGKKMIATTILEESMHLESGKQDETRGFQDFIINKFVTILEEKSGLFL